MHPTIEAAFAAVPRDNFLPADMAGAARLDMPLPIGFGQTNSQPTTVAMMLDWLEVEPGNKILDVGSGSGWTSGLLSHLTGQGGQVTAVEIVPELVRFGRDNCARAGIKNVRFHQAGQQYGWPADSPYDRILVSAAASSVPDELLRQLTNNGRLVIPVQNSVFVITKDGASKIDRTEHPGFAFVPLTPAMPSSDD